MEKHIRRLSLTALILAHTGFLLFILMLVFQAPIAEMIDPTSAESWEFIIPVSYTLSFLLSTVMITILFFRSLKPSAAIGYEVAFIIVTCTFFCYTIALDFIQKIFYVDVWKPTYAKYEAVRAFCMYDNYLMILALYLSLLSCGMAIASRRRKSFNFSLIGVIILAVSCGIELLIIVLQTPLMDSMSFNTADSSLIIPFDVCIILLAKIILAIIISAAKQRKTAAILVPVIILAVFTILISPILNSLAENFFAGLESTDKSKYAMISYFSNMVSLLANSGMYLTVVGAGKKLAAPAFDIISVPFFTYTL